MSNILANKVVVDDMQLGISSLNVKHISQTNYHELAISKDGIDPNTIYIVSSDNLDMYGEQIKNLAPGTDLSDAVNVE